MFKKNITKQDLIRELSSKTGLSFNISKKLINDLIHTFTEIIINEKLNLKNFGIFKKKFKKERIGRNPKTKEEFLISARNSIVFIPSKKLYKIMNNSL